VIAHWQSNHAARINVGILMRDVQSVGLLRGNDRCCAKERSSTGKGFADSWRNASQEGTFFARGFATIRYYRGACFRSQQRAWLRVQHGWRFFKRMRTSTESFGIRFHAAGTAI
jgi:hypothetical protein